MIRRFWASNPILTIAFLLAISASLFFTGRAALFATNLYLRAEKPVAGWMTPRYIALAYGLDHEALGILLSTTDRDDLRQPLHAIAREQGVLTLDLINKVQTAIDAQDAAE